MKTKKLFRRHEEFLEIQKEGYIAALKGCDQQDNPYRFMSKHYWDIGWKDGRREYELNEIAEKNIELFDEQMLKH